jgi:phosphoribosylanthranilate isomerase
MRPLFSRVPTAMATTRIKICGITRLEDARAAIAHGADAIGLVFYAASPRAVTIEQAGAIAAVVPPFVSVVALFVDALPVTIEKTLSAVPVDIIQFHGDESPQFCQQFGRPWIKALRVKPDLDIARACNEYRSARAVLLDSWKDGVPGGTGQIFDWHRAALHLPLPVVLAGGLHEANVGTAIRAVRPAAVDVSGGVESAPGLKDPHRIQQFIAAVRAADRQLDGSADDNQLE